MSDFQLGLIGFGVIFLSAVLMGVFTILRGKSPPAFREIPAFTRLRQAIGRVVEDGTRLHVSLGRGALITPQSASAMAGLTLLRRLAELTSSGDQPPIATSGDAALAILSRDTLKTASQASAQGVFDPAAGRLTGLTPFSYVAGALPAIRDEKISANVLMGNFGVEVAFWLKRLNGKILLPWLPAITWQPRRCYMPASRNRLLVKNFMPLALTWMQGRFMRPA